MPGAIAVALLPIVILIGLGTFMRARAFVSDAFWPQAERLSYFVLLPALFAHSLATADLASVPVLDLAGVLVLSTLIVAVVLLVASRRLNFDPAAFTSVFQGGIRFNNYVGFTAAVALYGAPAVALAAVANAAIVPTVNILVILVFARFGTARPTFLGVVRGIVLNPLILGCAIGISLQVSGLGLPPGVDGAVRALGQASLPLGLLCVGAALDIRFLGQGLRPALVASVAKFVLMPLCAALACLALGLDGIAAAVATLFQALPTASSSYVMARQLGGDAPLMATIIALQTIAAIVTLPVAILLSQAFL